MISDLWECNLAVSSDHSSQRLMIQTNQIYIYIARYNIIFSNHQHVKLLVSKPWNIVDVYDHTRCGGTTHFMEQ